MQKPLVFFWFQTNNKATHDKSKNRLDLAFHAIRRNNTHDVFLRLLTPIQGGKVREAEERLDRFAREFSLTLNRFLSDSQFIDEN